MNRPATNQGLNSVADLSLTPFVDAATCSETPLQTSSAQSGIDWLPSARMRARERETPCVLLVNQQLDNNRALLTM
eukprot:scaffold46075_cov61-Phaeocystis_antarctica.AAC.1